MSNDSDFPETVKCTCYQCGEEWDECLKLWDMSKEKAKKYNETSLGYTGALCDCCSYKRME